MKRKIGLFERIAKRAGYVKQRQGGRGYNAAQYGRLYADWILGGVKDREENENIKKDLETLRQRSIDLFHNNDWVKKFIKICDRNIIGNEGLTLQPQSKDINGKLDTAANKKIADAFWNWSRRPKNASVTGQQTFLDIQHLAIKTAAREGEALVRKVFGFDNPFNFALQLIPPSLLPIGLNREETPNGHKIIMGIEYDQWDRPVKYFIKQKLGTPGATVIDGNYYMALSANEVVHLFIQEHINQARGVPWLHTAMHRLHMLDGYEDAELVASRNAAAQMGLLTSETGDEYEGDDTDDQGNVIIEAEPGTMRELPPGMKLDMYKPEHPTAQFPTFVKMLMLAISAGGDVAYSTLTGDLEKVNYSSIRAGLLEERDAWRVLQTWFATHFCEPIFESWLKMALLTRQVDLPAAKFDKFSDAYWQGRGWDWVDPLKDIAAITEAIKTGLTSWTKEAAKRGMDTEELFAEIKADKDLAAKYGLVFDFEGKSPLLEKVINLEKDEEE
ncbi:MAG: phage portal protein [Candidatus Omnitrophica bacterium]|nr:phage portal protein [Candidatus Omnitrophota bacterium]